MSTLHCLIMDNGKCLMDMIFFANLRPKSSSFDEASGHHLPEATLLLYSSQGLADFPLAFMFTIINSSFTPPTK